jgi:prolyl-tRNA synthetase
MFKLKDRYGRDMCLGMTHEEVIAWLAAREIRSYRDLPQIWYQIQTKERDEAAPRSGVLRTREFVMKDSYTLDPDVAALDVSYARTRAPIAGSSTRAAAVTTSCSRHRMMGGSSAHEFMAPSAAGEDEIAMCASAGTPPTSSSRARCRPRRTSRPGAARTSRRRTQDDRRGRGLLKIDPR